MPHATHIRHILAPQSVPPQHVRNAWVAQQDRKHGWHPMLTSSVFQRTTWCSSCRRFVYASFWLRWIKPSSLRLLHTWPQNSARPLVNIVGYKLRLWYGGFYKTSGTTFT